MIKWFQDAVERYRIGRLFGLPLSICLKAFFFSKTQTKVKRIKATRFEPDPNDDWNFSQKEEYEEDK